MMTFLTYFLDSPVLHSLAKTLLHFLWQGSVIASILYLALNALNKSKSELRYLCALTSLVVCAVAPIITFFWFYRPEIIISVNEPIFTGQLFTSATAEGLFSYLSWDDILPITGILWIIGVLYLSVHLIIELYSVYQLPKRDIEPPEPAILVTFNQLVKKLEVNPYTQLLISLKAEVPLVVGFIKPVILLPFSMSSGLNQAQLEMLLAHELAHVQRYDYLVNFLQTLVEIMLFFHPLVKWISTQIRIEREYCCDDIAVYTCGNELAYATALTDAEVIRSDNIPRLAMAATGGDLKGRVLRIIDKSDCTNKFTRSWHSMALAGLMGISLPLVIFSAHSAYQNRVEEAFSTQFVEDEEDVNIKIMAANNLAKPSIKPNLVKQKQISAMNHQDRSLEHIDDEIPIEQGALAENVDGDAQTNPSEDESELSQADFTPVPEAATAIEQVEKLDVDIIDLDIPLLEQNELSLDTQLPAQIEVAEIDLPKVQIASREELVRIIAPTLVRNARPDYPRMAVAKKDEAEVQVSFTVGKNGLITKLSFDNKVPGYFKRSVRKALRQWRFDPGTIDGEIAAIRLSRTFTFTDPTGDIAESTKFKMTGSRIPKQTSTL